MGKNVTRLFEQFQPERYDLALEPNRDALVFTGSVSIFGKKTGRPSKRITFHQEDLKVTEARIFSIDKKGRREVAVSRINYQRSFDEVRLHADDMLYPGTYEVVMHFEGVISRQMNGIYPCYFEHDGVQKLLIATQFESHHAREVFPCIDEPEAKATFDLTLTTPSGETVLANTPIKKQTESAGSLVTLFETTPRMSTYLLAFVYGDLRYSEVTTKDGVLVRAYATPDHVAHTDFALDVARQSLEFYNEYFDIPYPLGKCDLIALPDFASGAMENWGLITFREQALLVDPLNTSLSLKQYVANVVAHELTHQWFGNLVTMRWWTDLWLNESFASWMSYLAIDALFPDWHVWTQFVVDEQGLALKQDSLQHTHPIEVSVNHPDEIRTIFDAISYEKGASVLLMLFHYLGAEAFRDGLRLYLKRHAYKNTDTVDLWVALEEVSKRPVRAFMGAWTAQEGYPIVEAAFEDQALQLTQSRFYINPTAEKAETIWPIPLSPTSKLSQSSFDSSNLSIDVDTIAPLLNHDRVGFYRVRYAAPLLESIAKRIAQGSVDEIDRLSVLSDSADSAKAGYGSMVDTLRLLEAYTQESSTVVWDIIASCIGSMRIVMDDDDLRAALKPYVRVLVSKQLKRLGWEEAQRDSHFDKLLRPTILGLASFSEEPSVVSHAVEVFANMKKSSEIHPDLRGVVYGTIARVGGKKEFDKLLSLHNASKNSEERVTIAGALTGFSQPELIEAALALITTDNVRLQDVPYWIAYSFMNRHAKYKTWEWLKAHWGWLATNLGTDLSFFRMPNYAASGFSEADFIPEFSSFFQAHMSQAFERPVNQAVETIQWQAAWKARDLVALRDFLTQQR